MPINLTLALKFIYSEKAINYFKIFDGDLSYVIKSTLKISQNFVAFSENMNFTKMGDYPDLRLSSIFDSITLSGVGIVKFEVSISVASKKGLGLF